MRPTQSARIAVTFGAAVLTFVACTVDRYNQPYPYTAQQYQQPGYQQPGYQQPGYQQPGYQQPGYQQPGYQQPGYQQPGYQQPGYQQPGYPPPQPMGGAAYGRPYAPPPQSMGGAAYGGAMGGSRYGGAMGGSRYGGPMGGAGYGAAPSFFWRYLGISDCPGNDASGSAGAAPLPGSCNASTLGRAAVCWDQVRQRNGNGPAACTYKVIAADQCRGGANPGYMFRCEQVPQAMAQPPMPRGWQYVGIGDCPGNDVSGSAGAAPMPGYCNASMAGKAAVCWDQNRQRNGSGPPSCTYKALPVEQCRGGANPGYMFRCNP